MQDDHIPTLVPLADQEEVANYDAEQSAEEATVRENGTLLLIFIAILFAALFLYLY